MVLVDDLFPVQVPRGIQYVPNFISEMEEAHLIAHLDHGAWDCTYKRRRKHFGKAYHPVGRAPMAGVYPGPLPNWLEEISSRLRVSGYFRTLAPHSLVNEYLPGQGIADHTDADDGHTLRVASLSLGSGAEMRFTDPDGRRHPLYLERRSLVVFDGPVAQTWMHGIPGRLADKQGGLTLARTRRISLTFREAVA